MNIKNKIIVTLVIAVITVLAFKYLAHTSNTPSIGPVPPISGIQPCVLPNPCAAPVAIVGPCPAGRVCKDVEVAGGIEICLWPRTCASVAVIPCIYPNLCAKVKAA